MYSHEAFVMIRKGTVSLTSRARVRRQRSFDAPRRAFLDEVHLIG